MITTRSVLRNRLALVSTLAALLLAACGGGGGGGGGGSTETPGPKPLAVLTYPAPLYCGAQFDLDALTFMFTRSMDGEEAAIEASIFTASTQAWSTTTLENDTLTITPTDVEGWDYTVPHRLQFTTYDADDNELIVWYTPSIFHSVLPTKYYVNADIGSDSSNDGLTPATPFQSIQKAVLQGGTALILVAGATTSAAQITGTIDADNGGATYKGYDVSDAPISMANGMSLCGGFASNFLSRDPAAHPTIITGNVQAGNDGSLVSDLYAHVVAGAGVGVTATTVLEGFTIVAPGPDTVSGFTSTDAFGALEVAGELQVRNNKLVGGGATNSYIVYVHGTGAQSAVLSKNYLTGQPSSFTNSFGLYVLSAVPIFESSYIGSASSRGVYADTLSGTVTIANNDIDGGPGAGGNTYGIRVNQGDVDILNNVEISGGGSAGDGTAYGIYINAGATGTIARNLIFGGGAETNFGVYISIGVTSLTVSNNNIFAGGDGGTYATGVYDAGTNVELVSNEVHGHSAGTAAVAIQSVGAGTRTYHRNLITGGYSVGSNTGILLESGTSGVVVRANQITGCTGSGVEGWCYAIDNNGLGNKFTNNTVHGGSGLGDNPSIAFYDGSTASGTIVENNIFFTSAGGVLSGTGGHCFDVQDSTSLATISNNDFFSCGSLIFYDYATDIAYDVSTTNPNLLSGSSLADHQNLQDINPGFVKIGSNPGNLGTASVDWHLTESSPAEILGGGDAMGCPVNIKDYDGVVIWKTNIGGDPGTNSWPIGAFHSPLQVEGDCD